MEKEIYYTSSLQVPNLGVAVIASVIRKANHDVKILDAKIEKLNVSEFIREIAAYKPDVLGINLVTTEVEFVDSFMQDVRSTLGETIILAGGPHVSALPQESLERYQYLDAVIIGEGENAILDIIKGEGEFEHIDGIAYRKNGKIIVNPQNELVDMSKVPIPAWDLYPPMNNYPIQTVRGCPFSCCFCYNFLGRKARSRSIDSVFEELEFLKQYSPVFDEYWIIDPTFGVPKKFSTDLMNQMVSSGINNGLRWSCHTRIDIADFKMFELMKKAGAYSVGLGIESGDDDILSETLKNISVDQIKDVVNKAKSVGLETRGFYILGHPNETKKSASATIDLAVQLNTHRSNFGIMVPWPGTKVFEWAKENKKGYQLQHTEYGRYQKHFGDALQIQGVSKRYLNLLRAKGYLWVYLRNGRILDFFKFLKSYFRDAVQFGKSLVGSMALSKRK